MKRQAMKDKITKLSEDGYLPKTLDSMEEDLINIQPSGEEGDIFVSFQLGKSSITIPIPDALKSYTRKLKTKSRTIIEIQGFKIGIDLI